eukprot:4638864-Pyramimonas_sp.AAC.1
MASRIKQHNHCHELLMPGTIIDYWRQPKRKEDDGWRGPAELISVERLAGSAIIRHQGHPILMPLQRIRRH